MLRYGTDLYLFARFSCAAAALLLSCARSEFRWTQSLPIRERAAGPAELLAYPEDNQVVAVNPPGFTWTPADNARFYRLEVRKVGEATRVVLKTEPQRSTVYPPLLALEPGNYEWQVVYLDENGAPFAASKTRHFQVPATAPVLLMPDLAALKAKLVKIRPRLFLAGAKLDKLRQAIAVKQVPAWPRLLEAADAALKEPLYPEPALRRPGEPSDDAWLRIFTPGKVGSAHLVRLALAYKITGDPKYLDGAKRWLLNLASWDPKGVTSHGLKLPGGGVGNDEASMPMLERMSFAWDWIGDQLTPTERVKVLNSITERGNQVLRKLEEDDFLSHPFNNHSGRALAFLGEAGLSFLGDIPDAERWLDYVLRCYLTSYPSWGGDAGGWAQGLSYWSFYVYNLTNFAEALREVSSTDILVRPFYRNTGYLPVYFHPPYSPTGAFGDGGYHPPSEVEGLLVDFLAETFHDPVLKWQADFVARTGQKNNTRWREWFIEDVIATWRSATSSGVKPQNPSTLNGSRYLPDIGWVAMHSALGDAANDVWALFKSSRFGSYSHSHADQNTFQMNAYGCALAIDSGYYPSYGTPHDNLWTRQTRAHNGILVNGRGQPPFTWNASGEIQEFKQQGIVTITRGQAGRAYNLPQPREVLRLWEKLLKEPVPPMEPEVLSFERTLAFVGSKTRPVLIIHDYLKTSQATTFDWLLHALNRMQVDDSTGTVLIRDKDARLLVRLVALSPLRFSQDSRFTIEPEHITNTAYVLGEEKFEDQWHLKATTRQPTSEMKFLAVFVPYRALEVQPEITPIRSGESIGFRVQDVSVAAWWGAGPTGKVAAGDLAGEGRFVLKVNQDGNSSLIVEN